MEQLLRDIYNLLDRMNGKNHERDKDTLDYANAISADIRNVNKNLDLVGTTINQKLDKLTEEMELSNLLALSQNQALPAEIREQATNQVIEIMTSRANSKEAEALFR